MVLWKNDENEGWRWDDLCQDSMFDIGDIYMTWPMYRGYQCQNNLITCLCKNDLGLLLSGRVVIVMLGLI